MRTAKPTVVGGNILDRFESIDFTDQEGIKLLLYGRSGTGKTTICGSFPAPIAWIVVSGGTKPGELRSLDTPANQSRIKQFRLRHPDELEEISKALPGSQFKSVVLDHATGLQDLILAKILGLDKLPAQLGFGVAKQQQWGECAMMVKEHLRRLLSLDQDVVIVAHERDFSTESDSEIITPTVGAALTPSCTGWLNGAVDYIGRTFIRPKYKIQEVTIGKEKQQQRIRVPGVEYALLTAPDPIFTTKFRVPKGYKLPDALTDPDYDKILKIIRGQK